MKKMLFALITFLSFSLSALAGVNINTATQAELETLDGVGPVKAQAIIDYRKKNGEFKSIDDLEKVDGIGAVTLKNVRKDVSLSGKTTAVVPAATKATETKSTAKEIKSIKEVKPAKETKEVATEKAAASKTAVAKEVKETKAAKEAKPAKEKKADVAKEEKSTKAEKTTKANKDKTEAKASVKVEKSETTKK